MKNKKIIAVLGLSVLGVTGLVGCDNGENPHKTTPDVYFKATSILPSYDEDKYYEGDYATVYNESQYTDEYCASIEILNKDKLAYNQELKVAITPNKYFSLHKLSLNDQGSGDFVYDLTDFIHPYVGLGSPNNLYSYPLTEGEAYTFEIDPEHNDPEKFDERYILTVKGEYFKKNVVIAFGTAPGYEYKNPMYQQNSAYYETHTFICDKNGEYLTRGMYNLKNSNFAGSLDTPVTISVNLDEKLSNAGYFKMPSFKDFKYDEEGKPLDYKNLEVWGIIKNTSGQTIKSEKISGLNVKSDVFSVLESGNAFTLGWKALMKDDMSDVRYTEIQVRIPDLFEEGPTTGTSRFEEEYFKESENSPLNFYAASIGSDKFNRPVVSAPDSNKIKITTKVEGETQDFYVKDNWLGNTKDDGSASIIGTFGLIEKGYKPLSPDDVHIKGQGENASCDISFTSKNSGEWVLTTNREAYYKDSDNGETELKYSISNDETCTLIELNPNDRKSPNLPYELQYNAETSIRYYAIVMKKTFTTVHKNIDKLWIELERAPIAKCDVTIDFSVFNEQIGYANFISGDQWEMTKLYQNSFDTTSSNRAEINICARPGYDVDPAEWDWSNLPNNAKIKYKTISLQDKLPIVAYIEFDIPYQKSLIITPTARSQHRTSLTSCWMFSGDNYSIYDLNESEETDIRGEYMKYFGSETVKEEKTVSYKVVPNDGYNVTRENIKIDETLATQIDFEFDEDTMTISFLASSMPKENQEVYTTIQIDPAQ